jgi:5-formyltetrahydrofolate cyclo-ligase
VTDTTIAQARQAIRERIWTLLQAQGAATGDPHGSIPAFVGADAAADRLGNRSEWRDAGVIKAVPDRPQLPVRVRGLTDGKIVYMAVPNMADIRPFISSIRLRPRPRSSRPPAVEVQPPPHPESAPRRCDQST